MKPISKIAEAIQPSATLAISELSKNMKAKGIDVIGFGAGEPDFATPEKIKQAGIDAIASNKSHYTPSAGILPLREAICAYLKNTFGLSYSAKQVCVTSGAKHALYIAFRAILNPGDEVILPAPYWVTYAEAIKMCGAVPVIIETTEQQRFKITAEMLQAAVTDKTKCVVLTNPSNPTGMLYSRQELVSIADVIVNNDLYVMDDEIYATLVYSGEFTSIASLGEDIKARTLIINGVSKTYAMTGWRIGFVVANEEISKAIVTYLDHSTGNPYNAAQYAAMEAYSGDQSCAEEMKREFEKRRAYFIKRVNDIDGVSCLEPDGAFYIFMNVKEQIGRTIHGEKIESASDFSQALLKHGLVATVPGIAFGAEGYIRWSYATSMENIEKGLDRLEAFLKS